MSLTYVTKNLRYCEACGQYHYTLEKDDCARVARRLENAARREHEEERAAAALAPPQPATVIRRPRPGDHGDRLVSASRRGTTFFRPRRPGEQIGSLREEP